MNELLATADQLLTGDLPKTRGLWTRITPFLIRGALEDSLADLYTRREPTAAHASARAQLLLLSSYVDDAGLVAEVRETWAGLSRACHHHAYELAPTAAELRGWWRTVERLALLVLKEM